ncbi:MAG: ABC transporter permease, partial [Gammaproteobacteria bacterium]|nr:ABC transporter permease [Gammaproteobacteria bacterium]
GTEIEALDRYGGNYAAFLLIGIALTDSLGVSVSTFATQIREGQMTGALEATMMSPVKLWRILVYSSLWSYVLSALRFSLYLALGLLFFSVDLEKANLAASLLVFVLTVCSFAGLGMFWASIVMLVKRGEAIMNLLGGAFLLLGGVMFPISVLPEWLQVLSSLIPLTYGLEGMRLALLQGFGLAQLAETILILGGFSLVLITLGIVCFNASVWLVKERGSLTQF